MVLQNFSKFVWTHMTKWHQEKKCVSGNNMSFINKELSSAHKNRTQLRNRYLRKRSYQKKRLYTKQIIFVFRYNEKLKKSTMPI